MRQLLAKLIVSISMDRDKPIPTWCLKLLKSRLFGFKRLGSDAQQQLARHRLLEQQLKDQADTWCDVADIQQDKSQPTPNELLSQPVRPEAAGHASPVALAICICVLAALGWLGWQSLPRSGQPESTQHAIHEPPENVPSAPDIRPILASVAATEQVCSRVSEGTRNLFARISDSTQWLAIDQPLSRALQTRESIQQTGRDVSSAVSRMAATLTQEEGRSPETDASRSGT